jgi:hypothetical protein
MYKVFAIICALLLFAGGAYYFTRQKPESPTERETTAPGSKTNSTIYHRDVPEGFLEYRSIDYKFSLLYPKGLSINERSEGGGATTITFQNVSKGDGFQIFVTPYAEQEVSEERFKQDNPSGVRQSLAPIALDGASGVAFYGSDATFGTTREVWFLNSGYLFEITTIKAKEAWLKGILETWKFVK